MGKTNFAISLAQKLKTEIFSADSRQFYRELHIGVAKPATDELAQVKHHFIGHISIHDHYSAGQYEKDCSKALNQHFRANKTAILVGGSGLFVKAVLQGLDHFPPVDAELRQQLNKRLETEGLAALFAQLELLDPETARSIDAENPRRVFRALEVCLQTGRPYSSFIGRKDETRGFGTYHIQLALPRPLLYERINQRVEQMMQAGQLDEARSLFEHRQLNALQTVGYSELFDFFEGKHDLNTAIDLIKQHTRNYAKRQETWLRKQPFDLQLAPPVEENRLDALANELLKRVAAL